MNDVGPRSGGTALIEAARRAIEEAPAPADGVEVARAVAADLAAFYRDRLYRRTKKRPCVPFPPIGGPPPD